MIQHIVQATAIAIRCLTGLEGKSFLLKTPYILKRENEEIELKPTCESPP